MAGFGGGSKLCPIGITIFEIRSARRHFQTYHLRTRGEAVALYLRVEPPELPVNAIIKPMKQEVAAQWSLKRSGEVY